MRPDNDFREAIRRMQKLPPNEIEALGKTYRTDCEPGGMVDAPEKSADWYAAMCLYEYRRGACKFEQGPDTKTRLALFDERRQWSEEDWIVYINDEGEWGSEHISLEVCRDCFCRDIQAQMWVMLNTTPPAVLDDAGGYLWCEGCSIVFGDGEQKRTGEAATGDPKVWSIPQNEKGEYITDPKDWPPELRAKVKENLDGAGYGIEWMLGQESEAILG